MNKQRLAGSRYITGFDGMRTLAVLGVIIYHLSPTTLPGGYLGVVIFFVLTGYLITDLLKQEQEQYTKINLRQFYQRRIRRLFPLLIFVLTTSTLYIVAFQQNLLTHLRGAVLSSAFYVNNIWQILQGSSYFDRFGNESPFKHIWALSIEGQFYLLWPLIFVGLTYLVKKTRIAFRILIGLSIISALTMAVLYHPGTDPSRVYYGTDTRAFSLLLGAALAFIWPSTKLKVGIPAGNRKMLDRVGMVSLGLIILSYLVANDAQPLVYQGGMYLFTIIVTSLTMVVVHPASRMNRLLTSSFFKYIGSRSYGIYLWQFPIMIFYEAKIDVGNHPFFHALLELAIILLASELSYRLIERPSARLSLGEWWQNTKSAYRHPARTGTNLKVYGWSGLIISMLIIIALPATGNQKPSANKLQSKIKANSQLIKRHADVQSSSSSQDSAAIQQTAQKFGLTTQQVSAAQNKDVTAIGDSVVLASAQQLQTVFPKMNINAEVGRQIYGSYDVLTDLVQTKKLDDTVLVSLGTNGAWTSEQFDRFMTLVGSKRQVYWVNIHAPAQRWQNQVNQALIDASKQYKNLHVINWNQASAQHAEWFYADQVHPNGAGEIVYTKVVTNAIVPK